MSAHFLLQSASPLLHPWAHGNGAKYPLNEDRHPSKTTRLKGHGPLSVK